MPLAPHTTRPASRILASTRSRSGGSRSSASTNEDISGRRARAVRNDLLESRFDACIAHGKDHVLDRLGQRGRGTQSRQRRKRIDSADSPRRAGPSKPPLSRFSTDWRPTVPAALGRAQHRDRAGTKQRFQAMRHVGPVTQLVRSPRQASRGAAADRRTRLRPRDSAP